MYLCFPSEQSYVHLLLLIIFFIQVISQLRILGRSVTAGSKFDREIWSNELSPVLNLWKKLNQVSSEIFFLCFPFFLPILFFQFYPQIVHVGKYVGKFLHGSALNVYSILEKDGGKKSNRSAQEAVLPCNLSYPGNVLWRPLCLIHILLTPCLLSPLSVKSVTAVKGEIFQRNPSAKEKQFINWSWLVSIL